MQTFVESNLQFVFPAAWYVKKYDTHRFYQYLSGEGLKGVDFIAIKKNQLLLLEVKNYQDRISLDRYEPLQNLLLHPEAYAERYSQKFTDSAQLIRIIYRFYNRKFWFRQLFLPLANRLPLSWVIRTEAGFWARAYHLLAHEGQPEEILWLELGDQIGLEEKQQLLKTIAEQILPSRIASREQPFDHIEVKEI